MRGLRWVALGLAVGLGQFREIPAREVCLDCHDPRATSSDSAHTALHWLQVSVHAGFDCSACHGDIDLSRHPGEPRPVDCASCHVESDLLYRESVHGQKRAQGDPQAPFCYDCHGSHNIRSHSDPQAPITRLHIPGMCARCHATVRGVRRLTRGEPAPYEAYKNSIHGRLILEAGIELAAICSDCHEPHGQRRKYDPRARIFKSNVPSTCGECHGEIAGVFAGSVHGQAVREGNIEAPVCTDCHSEHGILPPDDRASMVYGANISRTTCLNCHRTLQLATETGYYEGKRFNYRDSYHGAASRAGRVEVANCASCHGIHDILPSTDPQSKIHKDNLPATCGACHPQAGVNFARGSVHDLLEAEGKSPAAWVRDIYIWLIALVLGAMLAHNALLFGFHLRHRHRQPEAGAEYLRFTRSERWQHWMLTVLFIGLAITGFAFRFADSWWAHWWVGSAEGFALRDFLHRLFGALFGGLMLFHIAYIWGTRRGREIQRQLWPTRQDFTALWENLKYHLGRVQARPAVRGLFDYAEKAEYWALVWGSWIMLLTGLPMWFENRALSIMPLWLLDVLRAVHFYEAILATSAVVVWHFYFVIFDPEHYPLNRSMISGRARPRHGGEVPRSDLLGEDPGRLGKAEPPVATGPGSARDPWRADPPP